MEQLAVIESEVLPGSVVRSSSGADLFVAKVRQGWCASLSVYFSTVVCRIVPASYAVELLVLLVISYY